MAMLDFGAGTGLVTLALLPYVGSVVAVDASAGMLGVLHGKLSGLGCETVETLQADISCDALPVAAFDVTVSSMALHHVKDAKAAVEALIDTLRPGGWLALADLDTEDGSFHGDMEGIHHTGLPREQVCSWLRERGLRNVAAYDAHRIKKAGREYGVFLAVGQMG